MARKSFHFAYVNVVKTFLIFSANLCSFWVICCNSSAKGVQLQLVFAIFAYDIKRKIFPYLSNAVNFAIFISTPERSSCLSACIFLSKVISCQKASSIIFKETTADSFLISTPPWVQMNNNKINVLYWFTILSCISSTVNFFLQFGDTFSSCIEEFWDEVYNKTCIWIERDPKKITNIISSQEKCFFMKCSKQHHVIWYIKNYL